jgi:hypothetical protein
MRTTIFINVKKAENYFAVESHLPFLSLPRLCRVARSHTNHTQCRVVEQSLTIAYHPENITQQFDHCFSFTVKFSHSKMLFIEQFLSHKHNAGSIYPGGQRSLQFSCDADCAALRQQSRRVSLHAERQPVVSEEKVKICDSKFGENKIQLTFRH